MYRSIYSLIIIILLIVAPRAWATITIAGTAQVSTYNTSTNTIAMSLPLGGGTAASNTMEIISCQQDDTGNAGYTCPSGWSVVPNSYQTNGVISIGACYNIYTASSSIPSTATMTTTDSGGGRWACMSIAFTGMATSTPWDSASTGQSSTVSATTLPIPSITTTTTSGDAIIAAGIVKGDIGAGSTPTFSSSASTPTKTITRALTSADSYGAIGYWIQSSPGVTGAATLGTWSGALEPNASWIAALKPSGAAPATIPGVVIVP